MKFAAVLKVTAAALATGALMVTGIAPASAAAAYPPHVSGLYASPIVTSGYTSVSVSGEYLTAGMTVKATRGSHSAVASVQVDSTGTIGTALVKVKYLLSSTAGRYPIDFTLQGASVTGTVATTQTYTVGTAITIKSLTVTRKSYGLYVSGKAAKYTPVKISIKFGSKTYYKTVKASKSGYFSYKFKKTSKGTYTVTAQVAANTKYFSEPVTVTYDRT
jgi:hypothetical protein